MWSVIAEILPLGLASLNLPAAIITIAVLRERRGIFRAFVYVLGLALFYVAFTAFMATMIGRMPAAQGGPGVLRNAFYICLGLLLLAFGVRELFQGSEDSRAPSAAPDTDESSSTASKLTQMGTRAINFTASRHPILLFLLGFMMAMTGIKNLILFTAGLSEIAAAKLPDVESLAVLAILFVAILWGQVIPVILQVVAPLHAAAILERITRWLVKNQRIILAVVCVVLGIKLLVEGALALGIL